MRVAAPGNIMTESFLTLPWIEKFSYKPTFQLEKRLSCFTNLQSSLFTRSSLAATDRPAAPPRWWWCWWWAAKSSESVQLWNPIPIIRMNDLPKLTQNTPYSLAAKVRVGWPSNWRILTSGNSHSLVNTTVALVAAVWTDVIIAQKHMLLFLNHDHPHPNNIKLQEDILACLSQMVAGLRSYWKCTCQLYAEEGAFTY